MLVLKQKIKRYITTNLAQPHQEWLEATVYNQNDTIIHENKIYKCITNNNLGVNPSLNTGKWLLFGVDNAYASIDLHARTATIIDDGLTDIQLTFDATTFTHVGLQGVQGGTLTLDEKDALGNSLKKVTYPIGKVRTNANNWYNYYYLPIPDQSGSGEGLPIDVLLDTILPNTATITVTLDRSSKGEAFISSLVGGIGVYVGDTQYGVNLRLVDYSTKETDEYGITTLVRRSSRQIMTCDTKISALQAQGAKKVIRDVLGTVAMLIADEAKDSKFENLIILGFVDDYQVYFDNGVLTRASIKIEEVL